MTAQDEARALVARWQEDARAECDACPACGKVVMCPAHSRTSALSAALDAALAREQAHEADKSACLTALTRSFDALLRGRSGYVADDGYEVHVGELRAERDALKAREARLEQALREEWWLHHGFPCLPYSDDGEMQCCGLDFKRMPLDQLKERVTKLRGDRARSAWAALTSPEPRG